MPIRCPQCGYSNDPEFRFCGMCGAPLSRQYDQPVRPKPAPPPPPQGRTVPPISSPAPTAPSPRRIYMDERAPSRTSVEERDYSPVNGPSFLGLDPAGSSSSDSTPGYLLEDEDSSGHRRLLLGVVLLLGVGGGLFWQWQHEGYPWNPAPKQITSSISGETPEAPAPQATGATQPTPQPSSGATKPETNPAVENKPADAPPVAKEENKKEAKSAPQDPEDKASSEPVDKPEPKPVKASPALTKAKREIRQPAPEPVDEPDPSEALFIDGQRYLYGSGVPEDCGRARTKLMASANQSNSKAQSTVATMYATGHCLPRNLPSAYHWFAVALQNDRNNGRLQRDLEVIWSQMTAEEKQIALKSR